MKEFNMSGRGGAADGLAYFAPIKEIDLKDIKFKNMALVSAATVMFGACACGLSAESIKNTLKKLRFDRVMRMEADLENKRGSIKILLMKAGLVLLAAKTFWYRDFSKLAAKTYSWDKVKKAGRSKKVYIGFTLRSELAKYGGNKKRFSIFRDMVSLLRGNGSASRYDKAFKEIGMYWASADGVYKLDTKKGRVERISKDIIPMDVAIKCAIKNPVMNNFKIKFNGKKYRPFDLGILNNESNLLYMGNVDQKDFIQVACDDLPPKTYEKGMTLSEYNYNKWRPTKEYVFKCKRKKAFLNFNDAEIEFEFHNAVVSDIFRG